MAEQTQLFKVGDHVDFINDYGVLFPGMTITGIEVIDGETRYHVTPTDTPWYPYHARNLFLRPGYPQEEGRHENEGINVRYFLYAKAHGRTHQEMLWFDRERFPGGCMCGFITWIGAKWRDWETLTGNLSPTALTTTGPLTSG